MRSLIPLIVVAMTMLPHRDAAAQYAPTQDSTLRELDRILVVFRNRNSGVSSTAMRAVEDSALAELRRAGFRIVPDSAALDLRRDGVLNVTIGPWPEYDAVTLHMDVMQRARLARTGQALYMMTWYSQVSAAGPWKDSTAIGLGTRGIQGFVARWRAANRRKL